MVGVVLPVEAETLDLSCKPGGGGISSPRLSAERFVR